ncbi:MAG: hypothetical protein KBC05_00380 [Candidatus Hydrogenedentes bacterium]|nr:hypothetical protein [Candidatus Hydrogenedentota bacterium]
MSGAHVSSRCRVSILLGLWLIGGCFTLRAETSSPYATALSPDQKTWRDKGLLLFDAGGQKVRVANLMALPVDMDFWDSEDIVVFKGDTNEIRKAFDSGLEPDQYDLSGITLLGYVADRTVFNLLDPLLDRGASPLTTNRMGQTALDIAVHDYVAYAVKAALNENTGMSQAGKLVTYRQLADGVARVYNRLSAASPAHDIVLGGKAFREVSTFISWQTVEACIITQDRSRQRLDDIARYYLDRFGLDPEQEPRHTCLAVHFFPDEQSVPLEEIRRLQLGPVTTALSMDLRDAAKKAMEKACNGSFFFALYGKGELKNVHWRRVSEPLKAGRFLGAGFDATGMYLLAVSEGGRTLYDMVEVDKYFDVGNCRGRPVDLTPSTGAWYQADAGLAKGIGPCDGQDIPIITFGNPSQPALVAELKAGESPENADDILAALNDATNRVILRSKNGKYLVIGYSNRVDVYRRK